METHLPTAYCAACRRDVVLASELDAAAAWRYTCLRCGSDVDPGARGLRQRSASALTAMGYDIDGESAGGGCGSGGCSCKAPGPPRVQAPLRGEIR